ncbi:BA75_01063T0 [Komagataella pastoris]|uniref:BA75_01063T0 n=1 Tax=Komagataella pastoris TaxID=4922 RepID=A0A1B2JA62_PICPA|nr:BA75_01063T0 [Komagataella pastoris]
MDVDFDNALSGQVGGFDQFFDGTTKHADNAIDFSDEEELADEEIEDSSQRQTDVDVEYKPHEGKYEKDPSGSEKEELFLEDLEKEASIGTELSLTTIGSLKVPNFDSNVGLNDIHPEGKKCNQTSKNNFVKRSEKTMVRTQMLKYYFPSFQKGKPLSFSSLFPPPVASFQSCGGSDCKPFLPLKPLQEIDSDERKTFKSGLSFHQSKGDKRSQSVKHIELLELESNSTQMPLRKSKETLKHLDRDIVLSTLSWDDTELLSDKLEERNNRRKRNRQQIQYDDCDVDTDMILEGTIDISRLNLKLDMNDPHLLFLNQEHKPSPAGKMNASFPMNAKSFELKFDISNDTQYQMLKDNYQSKIRSTIGNLSIDHSIPATLLQTPFYKVKLSKQELRRFHRPVFTSRPNSTVSFSKIKSRKKKKDRGKETKELFKKSVDLTLGDSANFFLLEYSEEQPVALSNFGMGSKLINYYRKVNDDDNSRPKLPVGETHVLGVQDRSPFWNFGFVEPGNLVPTFYNNMVRAPIFRHEPKETDFLLIRSSGGGIAPRYFLRSLDHVFTVGQTFPVVDVPGPHSRKVTSTSKNRLKMIVYRVLNKNERHRLVVKDISIHFPDQNDMQNRQRLKEFMEYQKNGEDHGFWKIKGNEILPGFKEIQQMIQPEDIALLEAMQFGQLSLEDYDSLREETLIGQTTATTEEALQVQMAPWNTTKNFIQATQGKAMLQVHGIGDPSKKGEAISFLRISMKGGFKSSMEDIVEKAEQMDSKKSQGHSYNVAVQQKMYDEEISRVWYAQQRALSKTSDMMDIELGPTETPTALSVYDDQTQITEMAKTLEEFVLSPLQTTVTSAKAAPIKEKKHMKITRMVRDQNGILQRRTQLVTDQKVIAAYIQRKQEQEKAEIDAEKISFTNDEEQNRRAKKILEEELERLEKSKERRIARKKLKEGLPVVSNLSNTDSDARLSGKGIGKGKSTSRRCATCGALGHIRTNKACPMYYSAMNKSNPNMSDLPLYDIQY